MRPRSVLLTSTCLGMFSKKYQKSLKNPPETHPKSKQNRRKIKKNLEKWMEKAKMSEESQKMRKKCKQMSQRKPTWRPKTKNRQKVFWLDGMRETLSLLRKERQTHCNLQKPIQVSSITLKTLVQPSSTRVWGRNPRVLGGPRTWWCRRLRSSG